MAQKARGELISKIRDTSDGVRKVLDLTALEAATRLSLEVRKQAQVEVEDSRRMPGISVSTENPDRKALWLPMTLKPDANEIGSFFASAALLTNHDVIYYNRHDLELNLSKDQESIADGLLLSLTDHFVNLSSKSGGLERGRKMGFAIRIRGFFTQDSRLGSNCLVYNHRWFGNDPPKTSKEKDQKETFLIKEYFCSLNRDRQEFVQLLGRLAIHFLSLLTEFHPGNPVEEEKAILKILKIYLRSEADIESRYKRQFQTEKLVKGKTVKITEKRGPKRPNPSTLLIKGEWGIISSLFHPYWNTLIDHRERWPERVLKYGFDVCEKQIVEAISVRWRVLERLSTLTTARLNKIRDLTDDVNKKLKKAGVDGSHLLKYFKSLDDPVGDYERAVRSIFPTRDELPEWLRNGFNLETQDGLVDLASRIRTMYKTEKINGQNIEWKEGNVSFWENVPSLKEGISLKIDKISGKSANSPFSVTGIKTGVEKRIKDLR